MSEIKKVRVCATCGKPRAIASLNKYGNCRSCTSRMNVGTANRRRKLKDTKSDIWNINEDAIYC